MIGLMKIIMKMKTLIIGLMKIIMKMKHFSFAFLLKHWWKIMKSLNIIKMMVTLGLIAMEMSMNTLILIVICMRKIQMSMKQPTTISFNVEPCIERK